MSTPASLSNHPAVIWWLKRNPAYLLSAACMAIGVRELLVSPDARAGELRLMLITLALLQVYKWSVDAILLLLAKARRAPEDRDSLLLVAAIFWTGPLAATTEIAAQMPDLGRTLTILVAAICVLEFLLLVLSLKLRLSRYGGVIALAIPALLVFATIRLRVRDAAGTDELLLYAAWWCLAAIALIATRIPHSRIHREDRDRNESAPITRESILATLTLAAAATHLVGMNYAFLGHARASYAMPLLAATGCCAIEFIATLRLYPRTRWLPLVLLSAGAAAAATGYDPSLTTTPLPSLARDPWSIQLLLSLAVTALAAWRLRMSTYLHLAVALGVLSTWRIAGLTAAPALAQSWTTGGGVLGAFPFGISLTAKICFLAAAYALTFGVLTRSRREAIAGLALLQSALFATFGVLDAPSAFITLSSLGWLTLIACWLAGAKLSIPGAALCTAWIALVCSFADYSTVLCWAARSEAAILVLLLAFLTLRFAKLYRALLIAAVAAFTIFHAARATSQSPHPTAIAVVAIAFLLLLAGVFVSWHKTRLISRPAP